MSCLVLRADADTQIGSGHFMRLLALASEWVRQGGRATFVTRCQSASLRGRAAAAGVGLVDVAHSHPDPEDLALTLETLRRGDSGPGPWLVADGYFLDSEYHATVRAEGFPLLVVDDTGHLPIYHASVLLNQNLGADTIDYQTDPDTRLLLGPRFALLRSEFRRMRDSVHRGPGGVARLVVTMGGGDPGNTTLRVIRGIQNLDRNDLECVVVIGPHNPHRERLSLEFQDREGKGPRISLAVDVSDMAKLLSRADLVVSAAGSTSWELACLGVPSILVVTAENQRGIATALASAGAAVNLGWHEELRPGDLAKALDRLLAADETRLGMARRARRLVDGEGCDRVVAALRGHSALQGVG